MNRLDSNGDIKEIDEFNEKDLQTLISHEILKNQVKFVHEESKKIATKLYDSSELHIGNIKLNFYNNFFNLW